MRGLRVWIDSKCVLELLNRTRILGAEDVEFLSGVSVHVGLALENAWLHREMIEKSKVLVAQLQRLSM